MDIKGIVTGAAIAAVFGVGGYLAAANLNADDMDTGAPSEQIIALNDTQRDEVRSLVRETLIDNPEILEEVSVALEQKRSEAENDRRKGMISERKDLIFSSAADHVAGNPEGDVTIVEFFDYNCPYCQRALGDIQELIESDPNVKVVFKEFPVLSEESYDAALVGIAMEKQNLYMPFHDKLLMHQGRANKATALQIAQDLGADMAKLEADMADPAAIETLRGTHSLADDLGINGTPAYVIGDEVLVGLAPLTELKKQIANVRENGCQVC
ncbi:DsbA family protein [Tepidamorphus sp. 3E244]|uniref:DsbA family protein n=1 Tax=Tepidamorphus sp. 3E244 TaxID=3385498 RepID=UPI0038FC1DD6